MALKELPSILEERAFATWRRILEGGDTGVPPHEDGLTADHLSALISALGGETVRVERYSGAGEGGARNPNADFEWWIEAEGDILGLRLQAKLIDVATGRFRDLASPKAAAQALRCIENRYRAAAKYRGATMRGKAYRYPMYCLYTATAGDLPVVCPEWRRSYGCSLVAAPIVLRMIRYRRVTLQDFGPHMVPWAWPFVGQSVDALEAHLQTEVFGVVDADGDDASAVAALHDDDAEISDEASILDTPNGRSRLSAAEDLGRVMPPEGVARMEVDDAPGYVKRLARDVGLDVPLAAVDLDDGPDPNTDFVALISRSASDLRDR